MLSKGSPQQRLLASIGKSVGVAAGIAVGALGLMNVPDAKDEKRSLAQRIKKLYQHVDLKVAQIKESKSGDGQSYNRDTGNAFGSTTTYHSYTWDYCLQMAGVDNCKDWLDPYISQHGFGKDQSPLEGVVARKWAQTKGAKGEGGQYRIWVVEARNGQPVLNDNGTLNRKALKRMELTSDVQKAVEKVGDDTAYRIMASTFDGSEEKDTMVSMESLSASAQALSQMYVNNLKAKIGQIRRDREGIELPGGEDYALCEATVAEAQSVASQTNGDAKLYAQAPLGISTRSNSLQERTALCKQMMALGPQAINPQVRGKGITQGDPNEEQVDEWRYRVDLAYMENLMMDPNSVTRPGDVGLQKEEVESRFYLHDEGGRNPRQVMAAPRAMIGNYNSQLDEAAKRMDEIEVLSDFIPKGAASQIRAQKIKQASLVSINGPTNEMSDYLKGEDIPSFVEAKKIANPASQERTPGQLVLRAIK